MPDVIKVRRKARRKIIREWVKRQKDKRSSIEEMSVFAEAAAKQNGSALVRSHRDPYEMIMSWLLPRVSS